MPEQVKLRCPPGWTILSQRKCSRNTGEYVILCEKSNDRAEDTRYATWRTKPGDGCNSGHYNEQRADANKDYALR